MRTVVRAASRLGQNREVSPSRRAGLLFRPADVPFLTNLSRELGPILHEGSQATKTGFTIQDDDRGTRWVILDDGDFPALVSSVYTVGNAMAHNGAADNRLAAVFQFYRGFTGATPEDAQGWAPGEHSYWIYRYDRKQFYPFVPQQDEERNRPAEIQISRLMRRCGVSVDRTLEEWRPIWGIPF